MDLYGFETKSKRMCLKGKTQTFIRRNFLGIYPVTTVGFNPFEQCSNPGG